MSDPCLTEQYKMFAAMAESLADRRARASAFFVTVMSALIAGAGVLAECGDDDGRGGGLGLVLVAALGLVLSFGWYRTIDSYRQLSTGRFKIVLWLEKRLPVAPFAEEWKALGEGRDPKIYRPLTKVENLFPMAFAVLFGVMLAIGVIEIACG